MDINKAAFEQFAVSKGWDTKKTQGGAYKLKFVQHAFEAFEAAANSVMSLRDHFAGQALAALIGHEGKDGHNCGPSAVPKLACWAYEYADAMLEARQQDQGAAQ